MHYLIMSCNEQVITDGYNIGKVSFRVIHIIIVLYHLFEANDGFTLGSQSQSKSEIERSYWLRAIFWTQGVYTRVQSQNIKSGSSANGTSLSCQILTFVTQENILIRSLRNQSSNLGPILIECENKIHKGMFWTSHFLDHDPHVNPPHASVG